jgi:hypothetical protein
VNTKLYDIILLPEPELAQKAITLSQQLAQYGARFTLQQDSPVPHLSLYFAQLSPPGLSMTTEVLQAMAAQLSPITLSAAEYEQAGAYLLLNYQRTDELVRLHMRVMNAINPLRDGMSQGDTARLHETRGKVRQNLETYGTQWVGELFKPHITITRFAERRELAANDLPDIRQFDGRFVKLGLFETGEFGTCVRRIAEFELNPLSSK